MSKSRKKKHEPKDLLIYGMDVTVWCKRWGLEPFTCLCSCGQSLTTSIPFVRGTLRGLYAPPCVNGCHDSWVEFRRLGERLDHKGTINWPPHALVRDQRYGTIFDGTLNS